MNKFLYCYVALALLFCLFHHPAFSQDKQPLDTARTEEKTRDVNPFNPKSQEQYLQEKGRERQFFFMKNNEQKN